MSYVYFLYFPSQKAYKIGKADCVNERQKTLTKIWGDWDRPKSFAIKVSEECVFDAEKFFHNFLYKFKHETKLKEDGFTEFFRPSNKQIEKAVSFAEMLFVNSERIDDLDIPLKNKKVIKLNSFNLLRINTFITKKSSINKNFQQAYNFVFGSIRLSPVEHDLLALFLSHFHKEAQTFTKEEIVCRFNSKTLCNWFNKRPSLLFATLNLPAKRLESRRSNTKQASGEFKHIPLFLEATYKNSILTITPNPNLIDDYLILSASQHLISSGVFRALNSEFSKRLYTLLSTLKAEKTTSLTVEIEEAKSMFGYNGEAENDKKNNIQTGVFMSRVIRHAISEIDKKEPRITFYSNVINENAKKQNIGYEVTKIKNEITHIRFLFKWD